MIELTEDPISSDHIISSLAKDKLGAYIAFIGTVRNTSQQGNKVTHLLVEPCSEDAELKLREIAAEIKGKWGLQDIAISRRTGKLKVGEIALVLVVAAAHRQEAFEACQYAVDRIKQGNITTEKDLYEPDQVTEIQP